MRTKRLYLALYPIVLAALGVALYWICGGEAKPADTSQPSVTVGRPVDVAPKVPGSRAQTWASLAWSAGANAWLVAWREGCLNESATEIWCARVDANGRSLDPAGIRIAAGNGLRSHVKVASDGNDWLVVWADLGNGNDWDIYGCLVSANGQPCDKPFLIAGGQDNQCQPAVAYAGDSYYVVWAGFSGSGLPNTPGNGYGLYKCRVSKQGRVLDSPVELVSNKSYQASHPMIAAGKDKLAVVFMETTHIKWGKNVLNYVILDAQTGKIVAGPLPPSTGNNDRLLGNKVTARWVPVAAIGDMFLTLVRDVESFGGRNPYAPTFWTLTSSGSLKKTGLSVDALMASRVYYAPGHVALASDGQRFLYVSESPKSRKGANQMQMGIVGWVINREGNQLLAGASKGGFPIADEPGKEHILPAVCSGPQNTFLVVNSELRGIDDLKLVARIVK
jgi:hypothetical protein